MIKNTANQVVSAHLISKTDGSDVTSGTTTVYVTGDGGTQGAGSGTITHEGNGSWSYTPTQAETNYDQVVYTFVNTSAISVDIQIYPMSSSIVTLFWQHLIDSVQVRLILARIAAVTIGKSSNDGKTNRDISDSRDAVSATIVGNNRTAVSYNDSGA